MVAHLSFASFEFGIALCNFAKGVAGGNASPVGSSRAFGVEVIFLITVRERRSRKKTQQSQNTLV